MNLPNKLTVIRILLIPFLVFFLLNTNILNNYLYALIVFIIASITDHFDGKIAREQKLITDFGKFADPLADKILVISAYICFIQLGVIGAIPVIIILAREFIVTSVRLMASSKGKVVPANIWGKVKTVSQIFSIIFIILIQYLLNFNTYNIEYVYNIFNFIINMVIWICVVLTVASGAIYVYNNKEYIKQI